VKARFVGIIPMTTLTSSNHGAPDRDLRPRLFCVHLGEPARGTGGRGIQAAAVAAAWAAPAVAASLNARLMAS